VRQSSSDSRKSHRDVKYAAARQESPAASPGSAGRKQLAAGCRLSSLSRRDRPSCHAAPCCTAVLNAPLRAPRCRNTGAREINTPQRTDRQTGHRVRGIGRKNRSVAGGRRSREHRPVLPFPVFGGNRGGAAPGTTPRRPLRIRDSRRRRRLNSPHTAPANPVMMRRLGADLSQICGFRFPPEHRTEWLAGCPNLRIRFPDRTGTSRPRGSGQSRISLSSGP
jgi:hypothetical protein